jgi:hypothetical protein
MYIYNYGFIVYIGRKWQKPENKENKIMSFDKNYPNRKDKRKPYRGSKAFDCTCRNHGSCDYCKNNRIYFDRKYRSVADKELRDWRHNNEKIS